MVRKSLKIMQSLSCEPLDRAMPVTASLKTLKPYYLYMTKSKRGGHKKEALLFIHDTSLPVLSPSLLWPIYSLPRKEEYIEPFGVSWKFKRTLCLFKDYAWMFATLVFWGHRGGHGLSLGQTSTSLNLAHLLIGLKFYAQVHLCDYWVGCGSDLYYYITNCSVK